MIPKFLFKRLASQFRHPRGFIGRWVGTQMENLNDVQNDWVISLLNIKPADNILEIGYGTGRTIQKIVPYLTNGMISGIDVSKTMFVVAAKNLSEEIKLGKVSLFQGSADKLPFNEKMFSKVFSVHVVYFWQDLLNVCKELYRVTKPGGTVAIYFVVKVIADNKDFIPYKKGEVQNKLREVGFRSVICKEKQFGIQHGICVLGVK